MDFQIRECKIEDANELSKLNDVELGHYYPVEDVKIKLESLLKSDKDKILVATVNNTVVGYVHANDFDVIYASHVKNIMGIAKIINILKYTYYSIWLY